MKTHFIKSYSRNTTLFMQVIWAKALVEESKKRFGWNNPHLPLNAHYVNNGLVEIWEHKQGIQWFLDRLLEKNKKQPNFLKDLLKEYKACLADLGRLHKKKYLSTAKDVEDYKVVIYRAVFTMTLFFYTGTDDRTPLSAQKISIEARKLSDLFVENDIFITRSIMRLGKLNKAMASVVLPDEIFNIPKQSVLKQRHKKFILIDGKPIKSLNKNYIFERENLDKNITEVKGMVAFRGYAKGRVRIVLKASDIKFVKQGDILVTHMTTPDLLPAMRKAAAFVTDEGGITSHAAIMSREMNKPCVIGTKVVTKIFKNGAIVEVDANKGIVRKI